MPRQHHPIADLFPMLAEDELKDLAHDIAERGLLQPIVLDNQDRILDGRNRVAACELAGVEPEFTTYDGDDPDGYALSVNIARRHLTKGQQAMVLARSGIEYRNDTQASVSKQRVSHARVVRDHAPDLADSVITGAMSLDEAYKIARENKEKAEGVEAQLARLRGEDPELADKVVEGELTLAGAWAERKARAAEQQRRRRVSTHLLCEVVPSLAQTRGTQAFVEYDAAEAMPGRAITREVIDNAMAALEEMAAAWKERELS
jgi:hypothetical protein